MMLKNINLLIKNLIKKIKNIDINLIPQTKKTKLYKKEAKNFKKKVNKLNISNNSYITYISRARRQFTNIKHHNFKKKISFLKKKFTFFKKEILKINKSKNINEIKINLKSLKKKLNQIFILIKKLNNIKITSSGKKNFNIIKKTIIKLPQWKKELKNLIKKKWYKSHKNIFKKIHNGLNLLKKIKNFKINHEILFHLKIEKKKIILTKKKSEHNLKIKKTNTININYINYMKSIHNIIYNIKSIKTIKDLASLSFSLSAISGRRMIEIIKTGLFKYKKKNKIEFSGQAKTIHKKKKHNIYILWFNSKIFIKKIKTIRKSKLIKNILLKTKKKLFISKNHQISNYLSNPFNKWVKNFFKDKNRTYKDSRSIYSRISFETWFKKDKKWKKYDEDIFFYKILGHKSIYSQIYYKQFKLINFYSSYKYKKKNKKNKNWKLKILSNLDKKIYKYIIKRKNSKIHETTKKIIKKNKNKLINNYLLRKYGFNTKLIQRYVNFISKYINQKKINGRYKIINKNKKTNKIIIN